MSEQSQAAGPIRAGDSKAIMSAHGELHALLDFICVDDLSAFTKLPGNRQKSLLLLARSVSGQIEDLLCKSTHLKNNPH